MGFEYPQFDDAKLDNIFSYHTPTVEDLEKYSEINKGFLELAKIINSVLPNGAGKTVAIRTLSEARMIANHAISMKGEF